MVASAHHDAHGGVERRFIVPETPPQSTGQSRNRTGRSDGWAGTSRVDKEDPG